MNRVAKLLFAIALIVTLVMATLPNPPQLPLNPNDKLQHMTAFAALAALGAAAFRNMPLTRLVLGLVAFGAFIELVQAIPALNRDSDIVDLAADAVAALIAGYLARLMLVRIERWVK